MVAKQELQSTFQTSNDTFIRAVHHTVLADATAVVCSKQGDPQEGPWTASPASNVNELCQPFSNNFVSICSFRTGADGLRARTDNFVAMHALMLDDIGSKVPLERLGDFAPSWLIETSPGNYQAGFILAEPITDERLAKNLVNAAIGTGLCDKDARGVCRWMRLPVAINGKAQHRDSTGKHFQCRLTRWNPETRYTIDALVEGLGMAVDYAAACARASLPDPVVSYSDSETDLAKAEALLEVIDPDCGYAEWLNVLLAIHYVSDGSQAGLELADRWSGGGSKYKGRRELESKWNSFRERSGQPVTLGTLVMMARDAGHDPMALFETAEEQFEPCVMEIVTSQAKPVAAMPMLTAATLDLPVKPRHSLEKYSLAGHGKRLKEMAGDEVHILGELALQGQATVIYAAPNTGKTLLVQHLLIEGVRAGKVDPTRVFYLNMDDNTNGLVTKNELAEDYGFHMLANGHQGFNSGIFLEEMKSMIANDTVDKAVVVLDTLKYFVDTMSKQDCRAFNGTVRAFVLKGGTVIALAHTNKNPGTNGQKVFAGTSDVVDDFDCAYMLTAVSREGDTQVVEFKNIKKRGSVAERAAYSYTTAPKTSYQDLLLSVEAVEEEQLGFFKHEAAVAADADVIAAVETAIKAGTNKRMELIKAVRGVLPCTVKAVNTVLDSYSGTDPKLNKWTFDRKDRGAHVFRLLMAGEMTATAAGANVT